LLILYKKCDKKAFLGLLKKNIEFYYMINDHLRHFEIIKNGLIYKRTM